MLLHVVPPTNQERAAKEISALTAHLAAQLPAMLKRFASDSLKTLTLVQIPQYFDMEVIHNARLGSAFKQLLTSMSDLYFKQVHEKTLQEISHTLAHFTTSEHALKSKAAASVQALAERLYADFQTCFDERLDDVRKNIGLSPDISSPMMLYASIVWLLCSVCMPSRCTMTQRHCVCLNLFNILLIFIWLLALMPMMTRYLWMLPLCSSARSYHLPFAH